MKQDIIIVGGGPAGITAAIYALRANKKVLLLEKELVGGKIISTPSIENYPGIQEMKGMELADQFEKQFLALGGNVIREEVIEIKNEKEDKQVKTNKNIYHAKAVIIATGTKYKTLGLEKEKDFLGKGVSFCATCDGFFYKNKVTAVIGGGNTALVNALELANVCPKVYIIQILDELTGESILIDRIKKKENIEIFYQTKVSKLIGKEKLEGIEIETNGNIQTLQVEGIFLAIGQIPETSIVEEGIEKNNDAYIYTNEKAMTNQEGIFAAGDCVVKEVRQLTTAVNDGTIAALSAIHYIEEK